MKKFGTPIGAAPGSANENVGFADVGTPPLPFAFGAFSFFLLAFEIGLSPPWCDDGCCVLPGPVTFGGRCDEAEVELEVEEDDEEDEEDDEDDELEEVDEEPEEVVVVDDVVVVIVGVVDVVVELGVHDSAIAVAPGGRPGIADSGVPGGTVTVNEIC